MKDIINRFTLKESFKLSLEEILKLKDSTFFETVEKIDRLVKNSIPYFILRYDIGGGTNLLIKGFTYPFPVLTDKDHKCQFFPEFFEEFNYLNYHVLIFED